MDEIMDLYRKTVLEDNQKMEGKLLKKLNFSEGQWASFLNLVQELELNDEGVRIMLDEIKSGRFVIE
jgi:hypothetical protein